jgi:NRPS condensation-like uncharacterized protein
MRFRIGFAGRLDEDALREALRLSASSIPVIASAWRPNAWKARWRPRPELAGDLLRVVDAPDCYRAAAIAAFEAPIDVENGPQGFATLVRGPKGDSLCFVLNHMVGDAVGLRWWVREVGRLYTALVRGEEARPSPFQPRGPGPVLRRMGLKRRLRLFFSVPDSKGQAKSLGLAHEDGPCRTLFRSISPDDLARVRAAAKGLGATVNDVLVAAVARADHAFNGSEQLDLPYTVDLRRVAGSPGMRPLAHLSSFATAHVDRLGQATMADTVRQVAAGAAGVRQGDEVWRGQDAWPVGTFWLPYALLEKMYGQTMKAPPLLVTNCGALPEEDFTFGEPAQAVVTAGGFKTSPHIQVNAVTYAGRLTLTVGIQGDDHAHAAVQAFLDDVARQIVSLR